MCNHTRTIGDNYGMSCQNCGEQLRGYGYGGFFGSNIGKDAKCIHYWYKPMDGPEACIFCEQVKQTHTPAEIDALTALAKTARIALDTVTDGDARAHLNEIEKHLTALMQSAYNKDIAKG